MRRILLTICAALVALATNAEEKTYPDGRGNNIRFPLGDASFADEVVSFQIGKPGPPKIVSDPQATLGPPDYDRSRDTENYITLGCGGTLVLRFVDNALIDIPGPDLFVFEIGPDVESTRLAISRDGKKWIEVGAIAGGTAQVDIEKFVRPGESFTYVRLTDNKSACHGGYPGADIDAVGAIGAALHISLKSSVLFDFNKSDLKDAAKEELHAAAEQIREMPGAKVVVEGHTDNVGSSAANQKLSLARANSVRRYLAGNEKVPNAMQANGYGATRPVASNETDEGREKNRRVEILVIPR